MEEVLQTVTIEDNVMHEGQESFRITTPMATYLYHKQGAGFASLIDQDGNDWISYHPYGGSDGKFRGIPNLVHPEGYFHPGGAECLSQIMCREADKVSISSESQDGAWACRWDILPDRAVLTLLKAGDHPYWFLYEGTPGGKLDRQNDLCIRSNRRCEPAAVSWDEKLAQPRWVAFKAQGMNRMLCLVHHQDDGTVDSYWPMQQNMTVFGFGRKKLEKSLSKVPARFTVALVEAGSFEAAQEQIGGWMG